MFGPLPTLARNARCRVMGSDERERKERRVSPGPGGGGSGACVMPIEDEARRRAIIGATH